MNFFRLLFFSLCICLFSQHDLKADEPPKSILFVGNSYTANAKRQVQPLFAASTHSEIKMTFITPGGCTLERHLANEKTVKLIKEGGWDVVVLQEQSQTPAYPGLRERFVKAAVELDKIIKEAGAKTVFYQTWGRRDGDKRNARFAPDYTTMQELLTAGYAEAVEKTGGEIAPVGEAWRLVWKEDVELAKSLYAKDGSHTSGAGAYLAACVFYIKLTGGDLDEVEYTGGLPDDTVKVLKDAAKRASE